MKSRRKYHYEDKLCWLKCPICGPQSRSWQHGDHLVRHLIELHGCVRSCFCGWTEEGVGRVYSAGDVSWCWNFAEHLEQFADSLDEHFAVEGVLGIIAKLSPETE